jgi:ABC-2 type transport system ATP-binding protein
VEVVGLSRVFESGRGWRKRGMSVTALDEVSLEIPTGEVHGLLGPNGAGKTTLVKILSTVLLPTKGSASVLGHDVVDAAVRVRRIIGIVFGGERGLYLRLTARQNLEYWAALYRVPANSSPGRVNELLERTGLTERADERVETYSRGMKQRLHLARGLIGDPEVLFLDEPTTGMDPVAAREFRSLVEELNAEGRTILLTTHDMVEAEAVCDRVTLIDRGRVIATETPRSLSAVISRFERIDADVTDERIIERVASVAGVAGVERTGSATVRITIDRDGATAEIMKLLVEAGVTSAKEVCGCDEGFSSGGAAPARHHRR